jgi:hypothetical protein
MAYSTHCKSIIRAEFFKPLFEFFETAKHRRNCPALDDSLWLEAGVRRCLGIFQSGRDFLQQLADQHDTRVLISTFFESLKSKRRLLLVDEILGQVRSRMRREMPDPFACHPCLDDFDIHAGDGHFIAAASHDKAKPRTNNSTLPVNTGILADEMVATSQGVSVRRVIYQDPETQIVYHYLTNLPATIPPGLIARLYKARWDIEKVFDEFKNKLCETKAWASSATAKTQQARLLCLTHNLMTLMEEQIRQRSGVINQAEFNRKAKTRAANDAARPSSSGKDSRPIQHAIERLTQRTVKFIRWLKNHLDLERDWDRSIARLNQIYAHL